MALITLDPASCWPIRTPAKISSTTTSAAPGAPCLDSPARPVRVPVASRAWAYMIRAAPLATPSEIANRLTVAIRFRMSAYHWPM